MSGFLATKMEVSDYQRFVDEELCWLDGLPTHSSNATQRQCSGCRRKWNYLEQRRRFDLLVSYSQGLRAGAAAASCGCSRNTAQTWYRKFDARAADVVRRLYRRGGVSLVDDKVTLTTIEKLRSHSGKYSPSEAVGRAIFFNGLDLQQRIAHLVEPEILEMVTRCLLVLHGKEILNNPGLAFLKPSEATPKNWRKRLQGQLKML